MSRTYKDRPAVIRFPDYTRKDLYESVPYIRVGKHWKTGIVGEYLDWYSVKKAGVAAKRPKNVDTSWRWQSTPSWWTNMFMTRPARVRAKRVMNKVNRTPLDQLDLVDVPDEKKKPHIYYW
jgi:hypothetical protein